MVFEGTGGVSKQSAVEPGQFLPQRPDAGSLIRTFATGGSVNAVALSPDGKLAAIGIQSFNRNLFLFRVSDGTRLAGPLSPHNNCVTCLAFPPPGELLALGGMDGTVKLWHLPDMTLVRTLNGGNGYRPRVFATLFSKDGVRAVRRRVLGRQLHADLRSCLL